MNRSSNGNSERNNPPVEVDSLEPRWIGLPQVILLLVSVIAGALLAGVVLPEWLPQLSATILGPEPKMYWYLSRGSAFAAYGLLWMSMAFGVAISNKLARVWPGGPHALDLHDFASLLGLGFALFHALILLGDRFIDYNLAQLLLPFGSYNFKPFWVSLGQLALYLWLVVALSFYIRKQISPRAWRVLHYGSFVVFLFALVHGLTSGTDSGQAWASWIYWTTGSSLLFLVIYRIAASRLERMARQSQRAQHPGAPAQARREDVRINGVHKAR